MGKVRVPDKTEQKIIRENYMDPAKYGVTYRDETTIRLLCYMTRDIISITKGDRAW